MAEWTDFYYEIESRCTCVEGDDADGERPARECYGCFDDARKALTERLIKPWMDANNLTPDSRVEFHFRAVAWDRQHGWSSERCERLLDGLFGTGINGDYRLSWRVNDAGALICTRYSHDEPTGATFVFPRVLENVGTR